MGRPSKGWRLRRRDDRPFSVVWTLDGKRTELGLGTRDRREAERAAQRAYSLAVQGVIERKRQPSRGKDDGAPTEEVGVAWLAASTLHTHTKALYRVHIATLARAFPSLLDVSTDTVEMYQVSRLAQVQAVTVRKELATLRGLLRYAHEKGKIALVPEVRALPRARGTRFELRRRVAADELSPAEVRTLIAALPETSRARRDQPAFPIRSRFVVGYETGLRPGLLDVLSVPEHYRRGSRHLRVPFEDDKTGDERLVPLTPKARAALDALATKPGLIFGKHDYREAIRAAALRALPEDKAERFTGAHLRSARITHLLEQTRNIPGVQRLVGHKQLATTSRYLRASDRAAQAVIDAVSSEGFEDK